MIREELVFTAEANTAWFGADEIATENEAQGNIVAIGADSGEDEWIRLGNAPSYSGMVYEGGVLYAVTAPLEDGDVRVAAISATDGEQGWSESIGPGTSGLPAFDELHVYVTAGRVVALERATGEIAWEYEAPDASALGAPVVVDDFVATGSDTGSWFLVDRTEGEDATEVSYCDCPWLGASTDGTLYLAAPELAAYDVTDLDAESPEPEWTYPVSEGGFTLPVVSQDRVVAGTTSAGIVVAFER
ncbi:MAG: PQQ-binding-like beta-propeller repeat protein [Dehalococcoidia bacterium]|nr:PQQ-binding-like beta-propeller repeat protein [Dehalococcoidia bacterium]